jgi:hypothetical protein
VLAPVEVEANRAVIDDEQCPHIVRVRRVDVVDVVRVEHLFDPGHHRAPRMDLRAGLPSVHAKNVQDGPGRSWQARVMSEPIRFDTKIAVLLRDDLATWQRLNVTAFLVSGIAGVGSELLGEEYLDADGTRYLPMFRQPVMIFVGDALTVTTAHTRALDRGLRISIFTQDLFSTGSDRDNRAAVRAVSRDKLDLVGLALHAPRNVVDKVLKGAGLHG